MNAEVLSLRVELVSGYSICRLICGGWQWSAGHARDPRPATSAERLRALEKLAHQGATTFDCADIYTGVEELLGHLRRRLGPDPDALQVHTKLVPDLSRLPTLDRAYVERIVDRSLRRLAVERIDLVQLHWWDFAIPGHVEAYGWLNDLRQAGKVRLAGVTNYDAAHLQELLDAGLDVATVQVQYSLLDQRPALCLAALCRQSGIHILPYGVLAGGFLAERWQGEPDPGFRDLANRSLVKYRLIIEEAGGWERFQERLRRASVRLAQECPEVDLATLAIRSVLERQAVRAVIVGQQEPQRFAANRRALEAPIDAGLVAEIEGLFGQARGPLGPVYGLERDRTSPHGAIMRYELND